MQNKFVSYPNISKYLFVLFLFGITMFPKIEVLLLIVLVVLWISEMNFYKKINYLTNNKIYFVLPLLYVIYLLGMLYTQNIDYGWQKIETRFALLLIPIILPTFYHLDIKNRFNFYFKSYLAGIVFSMLYCIIKATLLFLYELYCREHHIILDEYPYTNYFFSTYLSNFMHYGYFAMYVNVAIILLLEYLRKNYDSITKKWKILYILTLIILSIFVMMLYSKAGIIALLLIYFCFGIFLALIQKKIKYLLYTVITLLTISFIMYQFIPYTSERISGMIKGIEHKEINPDSDESTQLRIFAWQASFNLIKLNPIFGYGTGDVNDKLISEYKDKGYTGALRIEMNAHNQYYQTMLGIGIFGIILLIIFYFWNGYLALKHKSFTLFTFVLITFFVMFFESYLETQTGVFYTCIFSTLFMLNVTSDEIDSLHNYPIHE